MPAHRSSDEAKIRDAVVANLRRLRPGARILHEIQFGNNRIDVLAVDRSEIFAVEIKSKKDKLDRLETQIQAMLGCAHAAIAAIHEKFLVEQTTNAMASHYERDGVHYRGRRPDQARRATRVWLYPKRQRAAEQGCYDVSSRWRAPDLALQVALPSGALDILWADELRELCFSLRVSADSRTPRRVMMRDLRWFASGSEITKGICQALRRRKSLEADPPIEGQL